MISFLMAAVMAFAQADDFPFGPIDQHAHGMFQIATSGFVPDAPTSLKQDQCQIHVALSSINVLNDASPLYVADMEFERLNINMWYGVSDRLSIGVQVPFEWMNGGCQDKLIARFHRTFGLSLGSRNNFSRDKTQFIVNKQSKDLQPASGMGDIMFLSNYQILQAGDLPGWSIGYQLRFPTAYGIYYDQNVGVGVNTNIFYQVSDWYFNAGFSVAHNNDYVFGYKLKSIQDSAFFMVEYRIFDWLSIVGQSVSQSGPVQNFGQYSRWSFEFDGGFKVRCGQNVTWDLGCFENAITYNNSADFGLFTGLTLKY